jgi:hypothetical protein
VLSYINLGFFVWISSGCFKVLFVGISWKYVRLVFGTEMLITVCFVMLGVGSQLLSSLQGDPVDFYPRLSFFNMAAGLTSWPRY